MDFLGFYEDWGSDFYDLRDRIFSNFEAEQETPAAWWVGIWAAAWWVGIWAAFRRVVFYFGTMVARSRLRTRKYSAQFTKPEELALLRNVTYYDQQVYEFARSLKGRP